jgi:hypothetical protein
MTTVIQYRCALCGAAFDSADRAKVHTETQHDPPSTVVTIEIDDTGATP